VTADYKIDAYRLAQLGFNVLAPSLFNMFGVPGTNTIGMGADLQAKHSDGEFLIKMDEAWRYLIDRMGSDPARTACIGHCMGGRLLIPFAADHPTLRGIVLYYPSVRDEPETAHRPRHAFTLAPTLRCASLVFAAGKDYICAPPIQGPLWQAFIRNGQLVEWHFLSDANHGFRHPDNEGYQPYYADLAWPLVTGFLQRVL
jgi:dienelactone hydrolase